MLLVLSQIFVLCSLVQLNAAHSWIDTIYEASNPDNIGYPRGYAGHDADTAITEYKTLVRDLSLPACGPSQRQQTYSTQYPELQVAAGSDLVATYLENGHVTKDRLPPDELPHPGNYSWFISATNSLTTFGNLDSATLLSGPSDFDDGKCAVDAAGIQGRPGPITCLSKFTLPSTLAPGSYQLVWWWDFTKLTAIDPSYTEYYTTCLDIKVLASSSSSVQDSPVSAVNEAADVVVPVLSSTSVKYPNVTYVAPTPVIEADLLAIGTMTTTFVYTHPTADIFSTATSSTASAAAQVDAVMENNAGVVYSPATMVVNKDGSLSPYWPVQAALAAAPVSITVITSSVPATATVSVVITTIYVPTYVTLPATACPVNTGTPIEDGSTKTTTIVMTTTVLANKKRNLQKHPVDNNHHHALHHHS